MTRAFTGSRRELTARRIAAQHIDSADFVEPVQVVRHLVAMQAQDFSGAKWAVGLRSVDCTDATIESAISRREIVRSWPMRGTLHICAPEDLGWILGLTRDRIISRARGRFAQLDLDEKLLRRAEEIAVNELVGGRTLSRNDLQAAFAVAGLDTTGQRGYSMLWYLSISGVLVFGPRMGKQHSFALLSEWVSNARSIDGDEAIGELALRYFVSHGPATIQDFAWWASLTLTHARRGLEISRTELDEFVVDDTSYFLGRDARIATSGAYLLPGFDEYLLGYQNRSAQLSSALAQAVAPGGNGVFMPTIVINGEIVGTWRRKRLARKQVVETLVDAPLPANALSGLRSALFRMGQFDGIPTQFSVI